jgi:hypothetical protein
VTPDEMAAKLAPAWEVVEVKPIPWLPGYLGVYVERGRAWAAVPATPAMFSEGGFPGLCRRLEDVWRLCPQSPVTV